MTGRNKIGPLHKPVRAYTKRSGRWRNSQGYPTFQTFAQTPVSLVYKIEPGKFSFEIEIGKAPIPDEVRKDGYKNF